jgi:hypothetical protein
VTAGPPRRQRRRQPGEERAIFTARVSELGKLKSYYAALTSLYRAAMRRRHLAEARAIFDRRRRVKRAILLHEEWAPARDTPRRGSR